MSKYDVVPHAMVRVHPGENDITAKRVIIDNDSDLVVWSDEHGDYFRDNGNVGNWRDAVTDDAEPASKDAVVALVRSDFTEPELCLEFLSELEG